MNSRHRVHHLWLILAAYGVWFALFSGFEEVTTEKIWKVILNLGLGFLVYFIIEKFHK